MKTNYINPSMFQLILDEIPGLCQFNRSRMLDPSKVPDPGELTAVLQIQYYAALRISEVLDLEPGDFNFDGSIITLRNTKTGFKKVKGVKTRVNQYATISPDFPGSLQLRILQQKEGKLFSLNRFIILKYLKAAALAAGLEIGEQQENRWIEGAFTHLIRKSRSKFMAELGASEGMIKRKLRHKFSITERYTAPDLGALVAWESKNIQANERETIQR